MKIDQKEEKAIVEDYNNGLSITTTSTSLS